jgi:hypothetical protein
MELAPCRLSVVQNFELAPRFYKICELQPQMCFLFVLLFVTIFITFHSLRDTSGGQDSSVGIATRCGLEGPGIEFRWRRDFPHLSRPALGPTQSPVQWVPGLSQG